MFSIVSTFVIHLYHREINFSVLHITLRIMTKRRKKGKKKNTDKSRKTLSRPSRRKFLFQKNLSVPSRVKIPNIVADMDSTESSFSKPKERISIPLEKGISIREPQPHTHTKVQADAEAQNESINSEYNKKRKKKNLC